MIIFLLCISAGSIQAAIRGPLPVDKNTRHLYQFDVESAGIMHDMVRTNPIDLALYNKASLKASASGCGNALNTYDNTAGNNGPFAGRAGDYNLTAAISEFTGADGAFTFEALVRPDAGPAGLLGHMEIISGETDGGPTDRGFQFRIQNNGTTLRFQTLSGSTTAFDAPITYTAGQWYHAAITYNGIPNQAGNLKLYWTPIASGASEAVEVGGPFTMTADLDAADQTKFCVGNELRSYSLADENFEGLIDIVRISSIARAPGDMLLGTLIPWAHNPVPATGSLTIDSQNTSAVQWDTAQIAHVTKHYLYIREAEPNFIDPVIVTDTTDPIAAAVPLTLNPDTVYYWRADASINDSSPSDANTVVGPVWSFKTISVVPSFSSHPADQAVFAGDTAVFSVVLVNSVGVTYQWYKGTQALSDGGTVSGSATATLTIADAQLADEGTYFCRATNSAGTSDSAGAVLRIKRLVSHYPLETDTRDSISGYDMILMQEGAAGLPTLTAGAVSPAVGTYSLLFDNGDHATNPDGQYVQIGAGVVNYPDISITAWVYWKGGANWQRIFDFGNDTSHYMFLTPSNGSECRFVLNNGSGEQIAATSPLPTHQWVFVAVTLEGTTGRIYINGEPKATNTGMTINPTDIAPTLNYIGKSQFSADAELDGMIDDVRIYNYGLSAETIGGQYYGVTGIRPCIDPAFAGNAANFDNTGSSYCKVDLADLALLASKWLNNGLYTAP